MKCFKALYFLFLFSFFLSPSAFSQTEPVIRVEIGGYPVFIGSSSTEITSFTEVKEGKIQKERIIINLFNSSYLQQITTGFLENLLGLKIDQIPKSILERIIINFPISIIRHLKKGGRKPELQFHRPQIRLTFPNMSHEVESVGEKLGEIPDLKSLAHNLPASIQRFLSEMNTGLQTPLGPEAHDLRNAILDEIEKYHTSKTLTPHEPPTGLDLFSLSQFEVEVNGLAIDSPEFEFSDFEVHALKKQIWEFLTIGNEDLRFLPLTQTFVYPKVFLLDSTYEKGEQLVSEIKVFILFNSGVLISYDLHDDRTVGKLEVSSVSHFDLVLLLEKNALDKKRSPYFKNLQKLLSISTEIVRSGYPRVNRNPIVAASSFRYELLNQNPALLATLASSLPTPSATPQQPLGVLPQEAQALGAQVLSLIKNEQNRLTKKQKATKNGTQALREEAQRLAIERKELEALRAQMTQDEARLDRKKTEGEQTLKEMLDQVGAAHLFDHTSGFEMSDQIENQDQFGELTINTPLVLQALHSWIQEDSGLNEETIKDIESQMGLHVRLKFKALGAQKKGRLWNLYERYQISISAEIEYHKSKATLSPIVVTLIRKKDRITPDVDHYGGVIKTLGSTILERIRILKDHLLQNRHTDPLVKLYLLGLTPQEVHALNTRVLEEVLAQKGWQEGEAFLRLLGLSTQPLCPKVIAPESETETHHK